MTVRTDRNFEHSFNDQAIGAEEADALYREPAIVAQKCTGSAKRPVFLLERHVAKGPWRLPDDLPRVQRELGCAALMRHWTSQAEYELVLEPLLYTPPDRHELYILTPALYDAPTALGRWVIAPACRNVSKYGPRTLAVVERQSVGVLRVSDRVALDPSYLNDHPEIWEHLFHRCVLGCGDSGLHNMLVDPRNDRAIGVDYDELRNLDNEREGEWSSLLFKATPARKLLPRLTDSLRYHRVILRGVLRRLALECESATTIHLSKTYSIEQGAFAPRIAALRRSLAALLDD